MNVILNVEEVHTVISLVTSQVLDHVELAEKSKDAVRRWRQERDLDTTGLDQYAEAFNQALGNLIDERTTRMLRRRGKMRISASEGRL
jgi:hypothetical protein